MANCMPAQRWLATRRVVVGILVVALLALTGCQWSWHIGPRQGDAEVLPKVSLRARDASAQAEFALVPHGDEVAGQVSLDLCQTGYPSEAKRVARHQVQINDASGRRVSSEAIAYESADAAGQAMTELAKVAAKCRATGTGGGSAVIQGVSVRAGDDGGLRWSFEPDPDADWPQTAGVARQAYAFEISDMLGASASFVSTYLRRGRILVAVYVSPPDSSAEVLKNAPSQARLVEVISARLASLPQSDVS